MNPSLTFPGHWLSGRDLAPRPVTLTTDAGALRIEGLDEPRVLPLDAIRVSDRLGHTVRFLRLPDGSSIETLANDEVDALLATQRRARFPAIIHWLEQRAAVAAAATVILVASVAALLLLGLPRAARQAAWAVPPAIEQRAGEAALDTLRRLLSPSRLNRATRERVQARLDDLARTRRLATQPRVVFHGMNGHPNAFALPGNLIVVTDELVDLASDDEITAVLAHELGHGELKHGLQSIFRGSAALLVVTTVTGDLSTLTNFAGALPFLLLQRGYSREFEQEADAYAAETLRLAGRDPAHLASILHKLSENRPGAARQISYLSTHPATADRIKLIAPGWMPPEPAPREKIPPTAPTSPAPPTNRGAFRPPPGGPPQPITQPAPAYPPHLRQQGIEGEVTVAFTVDLQGLVCDAQVVASTHPDFEPAALTALRYWRFTPAHANGRAVTARVQQVLTFQLAKP